MVDWIKELVFALWILIPAYAANGFPPLAKGIYPIDFGKNFIDGRRWLGKGKTFKGFFFGVAMGVLLGALESYLYITQSGFENIFGLKFPTMNLTIAFLISFGALFGDLCGSFIKRRMGMESGADAPLLDQLNFVVGALVFSYWFTEISIWMILIMIIITPILHRLASIIGYKLKIKKNPW